jgi:hypothetical protein
LQDLQNTGHTEKNSSFWNKYKKPYQIEPFSVKFLKGNESTDNNEVLLCGHPQKRIFNLQTLTTKIRIFIEAEIFVGWSWRKLEGLVDTKSTIKIVRGKQGRNIKAKQADGSIIKNFLKDKLKYQTIKIGIAPSP